MTKEERLEKIKIEYELYEAQDMYHLEDALGFIRLQERLLKSKMVDLGKEARKKKVKGAISSILGARGEEFGYLSPADYAWDSDFINLEIMIGENYQNSMERLATAVNDDNVTSVARLASFMALRYELNMQLVADVRNTASANGGYIASGVFTRGIELDYKELGEFFEPALKTASHVEKPQFSKK